MKKKQKILVPKNLNAPLYTSSNLETILALRSPQRWIFANRDLRLDHIKAIGFDMDFTLAIYRGQKFQNLTYRATLQRLVDDEKYPREILALTYNSQSVIRGLVMDKKEGTLFKPDCHHYVKRAIHCHTMLDKAKRRQLYGKKKINLGDGNYHWLDTLFEIPEADLYSQLVTFFAHHPQGGAYPSERIFEDVRRCMDASHADWSLKSQITRHPGQFLEQDPLLSLVLHRFRSMGKQLFLLTNSSWEYTDKIMSHLLSQSISGYQTWMHYFDLIVTSSRKPLFFRGNQPLEKPENLDHLPPLMAQKIWQKGNIKDFQKLLQVGGEEVLYIGDHIYGDIVRSKKDTLWRTCMIIPELEREMALSLDHRDLFYLYRELEEERHHLNEEISFHRAIKWNLEDGDDLGQSQVKSNMSSLRKALQVCLKKIGEVQKRRDQIFNPSWGLLMREDNEKSLFGDQVENYADLYTGRVSNFCFYSPLQYFRSSPDMMAHERVL